MDIRKHFSTMVTSEITDEQLNQPLADTLVDHIERVVNLAIKTNLCDSIYSEADISLTYLSRRLKISKRQALLFSLFMELSNCNNIDVADLSRLTGCRQIRMLSLLAEDKALIERGLIRMRKDDHDVEYKVPKSVVNGIKENHLDEIKKETLTIDQFFERLETILDEAEDNPDSLHDNIQEIVKDNRHLQFCKTYLRYFDDGDLFMIFVHRLVNLDDDNISERAWYDYFNKNIIRMFRYELSEKSSALLEQNLLEECGKDGIHDNCNYHISNKAKEEFFSELKGMTVSPKNFKDVRSYQELTPKKLFYNEREGEQVNELYSLLSAHNFRRIQQRLAECNMRKGFACLFYGVPGTGKTETVFQLAHKTHRDLFLINVAQIKSCWVGESEKNISQAFENYSRCVKYAREQGKNIPILLFNEADAVLGIRMDGAKSAVDKMENSIQNIILQEMERLDGIMIATTNLTNNLDKAFERRFIYKIEFCKPSTEAKSHIWRSMIPTLSKKTATQLARDYDFSGGQIENIARKRAVEMILTGSEPTVEKLHTYCQQEFLDSRKSTKIGYM